MYIKIIVASQTEKDQLMAESKYIHNLDEIDSDLCSTLIHIYNHPESIQIDPSVILPEDCFGKRWNK